MIRLYATSMPSKFMPSQQNQTLAKYAKSLRSQKTPFSCAYIGYIGFTAKIVGFEFPKLGGEAFQLE